MPANEAKKRYDIQYAKDKLKRIPFNVQKEKYEKIKAAADAMGESVNGYIKKAIDERMGRENTTLDAARQTIIHSAPEQRPAAALNAKPEKHYKPFTDTEASNVDLQELLSDIRYQLDIAQAFGEDALTMLLEKARQQPAKSDNDRQ